MMKGIKPTQSQPGDESIKCHGLKQQRQRKQTYKDCGLLGREHAGVDSRGDDVSFISCNSILFFYEI